MSARVDLVRDDGIATITLANDGKLNAVTAQMWRDLKLAFDGLSGDDSLRCVIVRGAGEAFAAGGDIGGQRQVGFAKWLGIQVIDHNDVHRGDQSEPRPADAGQRMTPATSWGRQSRASLCRVDAP